MGLAALAFEQRKAIRLAAVNWHARPFKWSGFPGPVVYA